MVCAHVYVQNTKQAIISNYQENGKKKNFWQNYNARACLCNWTPIL